MDTTNIDHRQSAAPALGASGADANRSAPSIDWDKVIDGSDGLYAKAEELRHQLHFLVHDLEDGFDDKRGRVDPSGGISLMFRKSGIAATLWLVGTAWTTASDLVEQLQAIQRAMDASGTTGAR